MNSKQSKIEKSIPAFYKKTALNQLMFGFVLGCRSALPTITIKQGVSMFMEEFKLDDEEFNSDSATVIFDRMQKEALDLKRTEAKKIDTKTVRDFCKERPNSGA